MARTGVRVQRRGVLAKRLKNQQTFRSVLSLDIEHRGFMPNLKISARNTLQVTGAQNLNVLGDILHHLITEYTGRGVEVHPQSGVFFFWCAVWVHFTVNY